MNRIKTLVSKIEDEMRTLDDEIKLFGEKSGVGCRPQCGDCCNFPDIEVTPLSILPLAFRLHERGELEAQYERVIKSDPKQGCAFYQRHSADKSLGRCGQYSDRPYLCRLFGFAARTNKGGTAQLVTCPYQKRLFSSQITSAELKIQQKELAVPFYHEVSMRVMSLNPSSSMNELMFINDAFCKAAESVLLETQYSP